MALMRRCIATCLAALMSLMAAACDDSGANNGISRMTSGEIQQSVTGNLRNAHTFHATGSAAFGTFAVSDADISVDVVAQSETGTASLPGGGKISFAFTPHSAVVTFDAAAGRAFFGGSGTTAPGCVDFGGVDDASGAIAASLAPLNLVRGESPFIGTFWVKGATHDVGGKDTQTLRAPDGREISVYTHGTALPAQLTFPNGTTLAITAPGGAVASATAATTTSGCLTPKKALLLMDPASNGMTFTPGPDVAKAVEAAITAKGSFDLKGVADIGDSRADVDIQYDGKNSRALMTAHLQAGGDLTAVIADGHTYLTMDEKAALALIGLDDAARKLAGHCIDTTASASGNPLASVDLVGSGPGSIGSKYNAVGLPHSDSGHGVVPLFAADNQAAGILDVLTHGDPLPMLLITGSGNQTATMAFSRWGEIFSIVAPTGCQVIAPSSTAPPRFTPFPEG